MLCFILTATGPIYWPQSVPRRVVGVSERALRCRGAAAIHVRFALVFGPAILPDDERALTVQAERLIQTGRDRGLLREANGGGDGAGDGGGVSGVGIVLLSSWRWTTRMRLDTLTGSQGPGTQATGADKEEEAAATKSKQGG